MGSRTTLKRVIYQVHRLAARAGLHVLPAHYYSALPNVLELERTVETWARPSELPGIEVDLDAQLRRLRAACEPYLAETSGNPIYQEGVRGGFGPGYGYIEAQVLHCAIRHHKPRRIIEVGSGVSTYCMRHAARLNAREGHPTHITSIEPYPSEALRRLDDVELIAEPVQRVPLDEFAKLGRGDFLFIDSSHTVKPGGDVNYLVLEVLPRLSSGTIVHFHDIYLPYDYQRDVLQTFLFWSETSLVRAFLVNNARARQLFCLSHLHYARTAALRDILPEYEPQPDERGLRTKGGAFAETRGHFPSSLYLEIL